MEKTRNIKNPGKKGSSGTFFAIVIILLIILAGVWGIQKWMNSRDSVLIDTFAEKLQEDVNDIKNSSRSWEKVDYGLPENFTEVCFLNKERDNLILKSNSENIMEQVKNVDLANITKNTENNEFCIRVVDGEAEMILRKTENNPKVIIERAE